MKIKIILSAVMVIVSSAFLFSQEKDGKKEEKNSEKTEKIKKSNTKGSRFVKGERQFRDWSVQLFAGQPLAYASNLESDFVSDIGKTYDIQLGVTRQITHAFAIQVLGHMGKIRTYAVGTNPIHDVHAETDYYGVSLLGDLNLSALLRRVDYKPSDFYKWAIHAYAGLGTISYKTDGAFQDSSNKVVGTPYETKLFNKSYYAQGAVGLRRRISQSFDIELKQSIVVTNDATFDGSGPKSVFKRANNSFNSGNMFVTSLGVHYKIGKKGKEHMSWIDPLQHLKKEIINTVNGEASGQKVCQKDGDNDGVCDEWDRELTTPEGARVDGSGVALDVDKDGVIDLFDQCVVVPGEGNPTGCPEKQTLNTDVLKDKLSSINLALEGIDFDLNSAIIKPQYFSTIDQAGFVMNEFPTYKFYIQGHTDAQSSNYYNYVLSKKRAESVKTYLVEKHSISPDRLAIDPKGETELKNPECQPHTNCDENKNRENRRIVFVPITE